MLRAPPDRTVRRDSAAPGDPPPGRTARPRRGGQPRSVPGRPGRSHPAARRPGLPPRRPTRSCGSACGGRSGRSASGRSSCGGSFSAKTACRLPGVEPRAAASKLAPCTGDGTGAPAASSSAGSTSTLPTSPGTTVAGGTPPSGHRTRRAMAIPGRRACTWHAAWRDLVVGTEDDQRLVRDAESVKGVQDAADLEIGLADRSLQRRHLLGPASGSPAGRAAPAPLRNDPLHAAVVVGTVRFEEVRLQIERARRLAQGLGQDVFERPRDDLPGGGVGSPAVAAADRVGVVEAQPVDSRADVLQAEEVGRVASFGEQGGDRPLGREQIPGEPSVREAHHAVAVRVATCGQRSAARAALGSRQNAARTAPPPPPAGRDAGADRLDPVAAQVPPEIVAGDREDMRWPGRRHGRGWSSAAPTVTDGSPDRGRSRTRAIPRRRRWRTRSSPS